MIVLPTLAAVVALIVGKPVTVTCDAPQGFLGDTYLAQPYHVQLSPYVCNTWERMQTYGIPSEDWMAAIGQDLLAAVHEAEHLRYLAPNEALTECRALRDLPGVISGITHTDDDALGRWLAPRWQAEIMAEALYINAGLPASYQGGTC